MNRPNQIEPWDGVRNYQARNMLRDAMQVGDLAFFYHSNCDAVGIVGMMQIVKSGYPDNTAFDAQHKNYDAKSHSLNPRWFSVDVQYVRTLKRILSLKELKTYTELHDFTLLQKGNRLSIMPVTSAQWDFILSLENKKG
jgi:predicted RNA-binding protein with PUA-like domain